MIINFKLFEMTDDTVNELKSGDVIVCTESYSTGIKYGCKYRIHNKDGYMVSVKPYNKNKVIKINNDNTIYGKDRYFYINNFVTEWEWESKKYNL